MTPMPDSASLVQQALALLDQGRAADAEPLLREATAFEPDAPSWAVLGQCLMALGRPDEAEKAYLDAAVYDPGASDVFVLAGHAARAAGKARRALRHYEEAIRLDDSSVTARYYLAEALIGEQDVVRASTHLRLVQQLQPDYGPAVALLGDIAFFHKDYRQAVVEYARAHSLDALDAAALKRLGDAFVALGDDRQALKSYDLALRTDAKLAEAALAAGELCERVRWVHRAARYYSALLYVGPHRAAAHQGLTRLEASLAEAGLDAQGNMDDPYPPGPFRTPATLKRDPSMS